jgi:hypothetical protein
MRQPGGLAVGPPEEFAGGAVGLDRNTLDPKQAFYGPANGFIVIHHANRGIDFVHDMTLFNTGSARKNGIRPRGPDARPRTVTLSASASIVMSWF